MGRRLGGCDGLAAARARGRAGGRPAALSAEQRPEATRHYAEGRAVAEMARGGAVTGQSASETARDETARLARQATAAFIRRAEAQEKASQLTEAQIPKPAIRWQLRSP